jgi:hypothetical protein
VPRGVVVLLVNAKILQIGQRTIQLDDEIESTLLLKFKNNTCMILLRQGPSITNVGIEI